MLTFEELEQTATQLVEQYEVFMNEEHMKTIKSSFKDLIEVLKIKKGIK